MNESIIVRLVKHPKNHVTHEFEWIDQDVSLDRQRLSKLYSRLKFKHGVLARQSIEYGDIKID